MGTYGATAALRLFRELVKTPAEFSQSELSEDNLQFP